MTFVGLVPFIAVFRDEWDEMVEYNGEGFPYGGSMVRLTIRPKRMRRITRVNRMSGFILSLTALASVKRESGFYLDPKLEGLCALAWRCANAPRVIPRKRWFPSDGYGLDIASCVQAANNAVNRGHHIAIFGDVNTGGLEPVSNFCRLQWATGTSKRTSDSVGQSNCILFDELLSNGSRKDRDDFAQLGVASFDAFLLLKNFAKTLLIAYQFTLSFFESVFEIRIGDHGKFIRNV